jgi:hypothetical protein
MSAFHGIKTPDGLGLFCVLEGAAPANLPAEQFWPVNGEVPDGMVRTGWELVDGTVQPVLVELPDTQDVVPYSVKLHALRSVFGLHGLTTKIDRAINNLPEPSKTIASNHWNFGDEIRRDHPLISALATMLSLTGPEVDEIFRDAQSVMDGGVPDIKPEEVSMWERLVSIFS